MDSLEYRPRLVYVAVAVAVSMGVTVSALAGPLDAADRAAVAVIDARVDGQIDAVNNATVGMDGLVAAAELAQREIDVLTDTNAANLRFDLERRLIGLCAERCAKAKLKAPAAPTAPSSAKCVKCVPPRMLLPRTAGGYLDDILAMVRSDIDTVTVVGLTADIARANALHDLATAALADGALESSFTFACMAYGTLSCGGH